MLKTKTWIRLVIIATVLLGVLSWYTLTRKASGRIAEVVQVGVVVRTIDLDRVTSAYSFVVESPDGGSNTVSVEPGRIRVSEADCPDRICVEHGWLVDQAAPVVCLPHRMVIRLWSGEDSADAIAR